MSPSLFKKGGIYTYVHINMYTYKHTCIYTYMVLYHYYHLGNPHIHTHINTSVFILLSFLLQRVSVKNLEESRKNYFSSHNLPFKSDLRKKKKNSI